MATLTKKRPPKAEELEMEGPDDDEVREGEDSAMPSRKRRARRSKAPMDSDCSCGKRKSKCDGSCGKKDGSYKPMMDRADALTPQEYLAACDLGIQGRSRSYIRARLDAEDRLDLKCGKGAIPEGKKCTKGPATRVQKKTGGIGPNGRKALAIGGAVGAAAGLAAAARGRGIKSAITNRVKAGILNAGTSAAGAGAAASVVGKAAYGRGQRLGRIMRRKASRIAARGKNKATSAYFNSSAIPSIAEGSRAANSAFARAKSGTRRRIMRAAKSFDNRLARAESKRKASKQRSFGLQYSGTGNSRREPRLNSIWADGFDFDYSDL